MKRALLPTLLALLANGAGAIRAAPPQPAAPAEFADCAACHNDKPDALGPDLTGVVGRVAGTVPGYRYSGPLKRSGLTWNAQNLRDWLIDPQAVVPGNRMPYSGASPEAADRIVAYLAAQSPAKPR
ncbi:cytochrome c family protein [Novosphingobium sp. FKTRR1]|uniref:c-type cytochrome n=1 Tax=Novosphingobium sp. FKTRR1 TaxID=2879118 RepID=UPI001CEFE9FC|nr:c-type cytochrome [Novosphingobium sp. FKTRR1]